MRINLPWLLHLPDNRTVRDYSFARRFVRSTLNPPAHPPRMGSGRVELSVPVSLPKIPPSWSAPPAEAYLLPSSFFMFFLFPFFWPKIPPKAFPMASPGIPKSIQFRFFFTKVCPKSRLFGNFCCQLVFLCFSCPFWLLFPSKIDVFFVPFLEMFAFFFSTCRPLR